MARTLSGIKVSIDSLQNSNALVLYKVGPVLVCSPTMPVESITIPPSLNKFPGTNNAEPGVFKSMHGMVRVVDLRVRFGVDTADRKSPGRIIISEVTGGYAGFWVDEIEDVIAFPEKGWSQLPALVPREVFSRALIRDEGIRLYADLENLDKFKTTGYLRSHIESIKSAEAKRETKKINEHKKETVSQPKDNKEFKDKVSADIPAVKNETKNSPESFDHYVSKEPTINDTNKNRKESSVVKAPPHSSNRHPEIIESKPLKHLNTTQNKNTESTASLPVVNAGPIDKDYKIRDETISIGREDSLTVDSFSENHDNYKNNSPVVKESNRDILWVSILTIGFLATSVYFIYFSGLIDSKLDDSPDARLNDLAISRISIEESLSIEPKEIASYSSDKVDITKTNEGIVIVINDYEDERGDAVLDVVKSAESESDLKEDSIADVTIDFVYEEEYNSSAFKEDDVKLNNETDADAQLEGPVENINSDTVIDSESSYESAADKKLVVEEKPVKTYKNVHIVVEGDTLWHISKRYVNDPWRYPELAKLSKIKDPDLIYPGQKVIIIYNTNK